MNANAILSAPCFLSGVLFLVAGLEQTGQAVNCTEVEHGSKFCRNAFHDLPVENASGAYCELDAGGNDCISTSSGSSCVDRFGVVYSGKCLPHLLGSEVTYDCYEDANQTVLNVPYYTAACVTESSDCMCKWTVTTTTQPSTVCDCYDIEQDLDR